MRALLVHGVLAGILLFHFNPVSSMNADEPVATERSGFETSWERSVGPILKSQEAVVNSRFDPITVEVGEVSALEGVCKC